MNDALGSCAQVELTLLVKYVSYYMQSMQTQTRVHNIRMYAIGEIVQLQMPPQNTLHKVVTQCIINTYVKW